MKKLKILFPTYAYKPAHALGGPTHSVPALAEALVARGHKVTILTSNAATADTNLDVDTENAVSINGVTVRYLKRFEPVKKIFFWFPYLAHSVGFFYCPDLKKVLAETINNYDLVHTHQPFTYIHWYSSKIAIEQKIPLIYHQRGVYAPNLLKHRSVKKKLFINIVEKPILEKASRLIALNQGELEMYKQITQSSPVSIVPNGVMPNQPSLENKSTLLNKLDIKEQDIVISFMARLSWKKGLDILLQAYANIFSSFKNIKLIIAGKDEDTIQDELQSKFVGKEMSSSVHFVGHIEGADKAAILNRSDLFCLPSSGEGFSMAVLEAMAASTAVMITKECNFPEVEKHNAGWIVSRSVESWTNKMAELVSNREILSQFGQNAHQLIIERFTWDIIAEKMEKIYLDVLKSG